MSEQQKMVNENDKLVEIITTVVQLPGIRVDRNEFLLTQFKDEASEKREEILEKGTIEAGCTALELRKRAERLLSERTLASTAASFLAGLPGGFAMAATIPADMLQYYAVALRTAQEIAYLYGEQDIWKNGSVDDETVRNQLIMYIGVMLGASGAAQAVRVMASKLAQQALKKLPQQALTKTIVYPIIKSICKFFGVHMTKNVFAKGVNKLIPVIGGIISGGITLATMHPMGKRLTDALDMAHYGYSQQAFEADWKIVVDECEANGEDVPVEIENIAQKTSKSTDQILSEIARAKEMLDAGILNDDEFAALKAKLIAEM